MTIKNIELLNTVINNRISDIHICIPAKILEYDYEMQKARVKPALNQKYNDGEALEMPIISNVPVIHPASGNASITFPVNINDNVLLIFSERSLEEWLTNGETVTPDDPRQNNLTDAIALLGLNPFNKMSQATNNTDLLIKYDGSEIRLKPSGTIDIKATEKNIEINTINITGNVNINGNLNVSNKITSTDIETANATIGGKDFLSHTHSGVTSGGDITGPVI